MGLLLTIDVVDRLKLLQICAFAYFTYLVYTSISRLYFHSLSKYPGPRLWAISKLPDAYYRAIGRQAFINAEIHRQYGPVVRTAPDELSFNVEEAWNDIYGKPTPRNTQLPKDELQFFKPVSGTNGMIQEPSDEEHQRQRRFFSQCFSEKALRDQEPIMKQYFDLLIQRLREQYGQATDLNMWYSLAVFDISCDLAFGESLSCLKNSVIHPWLKSIQMMMKFLPATGMTMKFYPLDKILLFLATPYARQAEMKHRIFVEEKVKKRLEIQAPRPDLTFNTPDGLNFSQICENAAPLITGGSEPSSSLLAAATYLLLTNPSTLAKLTALLRTAFKSDEEINSITINKIDYLLAILNEAFRLYPPAPVILGRVTPPEGCIIAGSFVPGNTVVSVNSWGASRSSTNFVRPNEFIPERWMGAPEFKDDKRKVVQPFSVGPRNCLGQNLAWLEIKIILARVIYNFDLELCEESRGWMERQKFYIVAERSELMVRLKTAARD
ncbi:cytochrome P450 ClCP1 [Stipitochalara longipes BDJ]|nr:cytochrome P450 ClCP1 [Stipitochalara longipes BDJ]